MEKQLEKLSKPEGLTWQASDKWLNKDEMDALMKEFKANPTYTEMTFDLSNPNELAEFVNSPNVIINSIKISKPSEFGQWLTIEYTVQGEKRINYVQSGVLFCKEGIPL